jgi:hypothetical protein
MQAPDTRHNETGPAPSRGGSNHRKETLMPLYHFRLTNGTQVLDNHEGVDLPGDAAARTDAVALARNLQHGGAMPGWDWTGWFVAIVDEEGRQVDEVPIADA